MEISARLMITGKAIGAGNGATTAHARVEIGPEQVVTASITNRSAGDLQPEVGRERRAVAKASGVVTAVNDRPPGARRSDRSRAVAGRLPSASRRHN